MVERGYATARGESYSALVGALAAADGAIYVARVNISDVNKKIESLNDPGYERPWLRRMNRQVKELAERYVAARSREQEIRERYPAARTKRPRTK